MSSIMRKLFIAIGILMILNSVSTQIPIITHAEQETPTYAKWGRIAMKETQSKYPNARIIDYLHEGSESKGSSTIEKFKLWLKDKDSEFGVFVRIEYNTVTEDVINIKFEETSR